MLDGKQYVSVLTGRSGSQAPGRVYTFTLDGKANVPSMDPLPETSQTSAADAATIIAEFPRAGLPEGPGGN
jgi:hypothetical protein